MTRFEIDLIAFLGAMGLTVAVNFPLLRVLFRARAKRREKRRLKSERENYQEYLDTKGEQ